MPPLSSITNSRQSCIDAVRDYYKFLIQLHLPNHYLQESPEGGWPHITPQNAGGLGKTDEVIMLHRHLPYLQPGYREANGAPDTDFGDWSSVVADSMIRQPDEEVDEKSRILSEGLLFEEGNIPTHVVGLTFGASTTERFLLDTQLGVIYWIECRSEIKGLVPREAYPEGVLDNAWDYASSEEEAIWRKDSGAWAVADFFEMLRDRFRKLQFYPIGSGHVEDNWQSGSAKEIEKRDRIREVFREYGWPDLERYRKEECLEALAELRSEL